MPDTPPAKGGRRAGTSGFSRVVGSAPDAAPTAALCRSVGPLAGWTASRPDATPSTRDDNSRRGSRRRLRWPESQSSPTRDRLGAIGSGISTRFPFTPTPPHGHAGFRIDSPACDCRWRGTLVHVGLPRSRSNSCYYHQDRHRRPFRPGSRADLLHGDRRALLLAAPTDSSARQAAAGHGCNAWAPSIFRAGHFGRWVVTHSLAGADFRGHRPAVWSDRHLSWDLMSVDSGTLAPRSVHPASPVLLTKNGPLSTARIVRPHHRSRTGAPPSPIPSLRMRRGGASAPNESAQSLALPNETAPTECQLSWGKFRREPATRRFDESFAPMLKCDDRFARQNRDGPPPEFPLASPSSSIVHHLSGPMWGEPLRLLTSQPSLGTLGTDQWAIDDHSPPGNINGGSTWF